MTFLFSFFSVLFLTIKYVITDYAMWQSQGQTFLLFFWGGWWWWRGWGVLGVRSFPGNIVIQCFFFLGYIHIANQWKLTVMDCVLKSSFIMMHSFLAGGWVGWEVVRGSYFLCKHRTFKNSTLFRNVLVAKEGHENVFFFNHIIRLWYTKQSCWIHMALKLNQNKARITQLGTSVQWP